MKEQEVIDRCILNTELLLCTLSQGFRFITEEEMNVMDDIVNDMLGENE